MAIAIANAGIIRRAVHNIPLYFDFIILPPTKNAMLEVDCYYHEHSEKINYFQ